MGRTAVMQLPDTKIARAQMLSVTFDWQVVNASSQERFEAIRAMTQTETETEM